ncbi:hypothetical protein V8E55_008574 [Tylopilus felleus]
MSADLQTILQTIQLNDYITVAMVTAVTYDYLLTLSREIDYVWHRRWSWVSTLFFVVSTNASNTFIVGSTFIPGPLLVSTALYLIIYWTFPIFIAAADLVMILRVYAMWRQSRWILGVLLFIYVPLVIISFVLAGIYYNPNTSFSVTIVQVLDFSFCDGLSTVPTPLLLGISIPRFVLGVALLVLAVIPTLKQSVEIYRATKAWQSNKNMRGLTRDGILYFLVNVIYNTHDIIVNASGPTISATATIYLALFSSIAICTIMPRFIISIRELYNPEARRDWQGIDSGFGLSSQSTGGRMPTAYTEIVQGQSRITEGDEDVTRAMPLQMLNDKTRQV